MDGPFYVDLKAPHPAVSAGAITLTTSLQLLCPIGMMPLFPANYFGWPGKAIRFTCMGQCTSGATPGGFNFNLMWGNGTAGNGVNLSGVNVTWTANNANTSWMYKAVIRCRSCGTSGTTMAMGLLMVQNTGAIPCPPSNIGAGTLDTTTASYLSPQLSRTGSTAETAQLHDIYYEALN